MSHPGIAKPLLADDPFGALPSVLLGYAPPQG